MVNHVIVGDGPAGITAARVLRARDPDATITIFSEDTSPHYYRAALTNYLIGQLRDDELWGVPPDFYFRHQLGRFYGRVSGVDTAQRRVHLENGEAVPYDSLLIASGASPSTLAVPGAATPGVATFRTMQDARRLVDLVPDLRHAVITGAGTLGLEWVQGLRHKGVAVTYILRDRRFMGRVLDETASELVFRRLRAAGVALVLEDEISEVVAWQGWVAGVRTRAGREIPCQLLGAAVGVRPNVSFLRDSGIATDQGVLTDEFLRTNVANVFAAGDVAQAFDPASGRHQPPSGLWQPARRQGQIAGRNMAGAEREPYRPGARYSATHLYDLDFAAVGETNPSGAGYEVLASTPGPDSYHKVVLRGNRVTGTLMIGPRRDALVWKRLIDQAVDVSAVRRRLLDPHFDLAGWAGRQLAAARPAVYSTGTRQAAPGGATTADVDLAVDPRLAVAPAPARAAGAPPPAFLTYLGREFALRTDGPTLIGRGAQCDIVIADTSVSRRHAELVARGGGYAVRDLGSANGTWVGLVRVEGEASHGLQSEDSLRLGEAYLTFKFGSSRSAEAPARPRGVLLGPSGTVQIRGDVTSFGRGPDSDIVLAIPQASRLHAQILAHGDGIYLRDMGSANGTVVNGARLFDAHRLRDGDMIQIGTASFVFRSDSGSAEQARAAFELTITAGSGAGTRYNLAGAETTIGRIADNTIVLADPLVTRRHASLSIHGASVLLRDLGSANGTWVNGERVSGTRELREGDTLQIGQTRFVLGRTAQAPTAASAPDTSEATRLIQLGGIGQPPGPASQPARDPVLVATGGTMDGARFVLRAGLASIAGREAGLPVHLRDPKASRQHAEFAVDARGVVTVRDLGSANGTLLNGAPLSAPRDLRVGDEVRIGDTTLRLEETGGA